METIVINGLPEKLCNIEGLDVKKGLTYLANSTALYLKIAKNFVKMIETDDDKLAKFLAADDINNFIISVHGYKSALANIGATSLSEAAKDLEFAGKENDKVFIEANFENFKAKLNELTANIKSSLEI